MSLLARIDQILPRAWLTDPNKPLGKLAAGLSGFLDGWAEGVVQARLAAVPGQVNLPGVPGLGGFDSVDALPMIARDRRIVPGLAEQPWDLAGRCRRWLTDPFKQTGPFGLLDALADILVPTVPRLRLVTDNGSVTTWYTREPDGTRRLQASNGVGFYLQPDGTSGLDTTTAARWDWDSHNTNPAPGDQGDHTGFFLVVYVPACSPYLTTDDGTFADFGRYGDAWNDPTAQVVLGSPWAGTVGTNAPWEFIERLRAVIRLRASCNLCRWIAVAFDSASFNPDGSSPSPALGSAYPNGWWGYASRWDSGTNTQIVTRSSSAEYWPGAPGGLAP